MSIVYRLHQGQHRYSAWQELWTSNIIGRQRSSQVQLCLFCCLFVCLFVILFVCLFVCLFVWPEMSFLIPFCSLEETRTWEASEKEEERKLVADFYLDKLGDLLDRVKDL